MLPTPTPLMRPLALALALVSAPALAQGAAAPPAAGAPAYAFGETGLRVTLPADWTGRGVADESHGARASYTFANGAAGPLAGAVLYVERAVGLNPVERELWRRGQWASAYGATRPVARAAAPLDGLAFEVAGGGRGGVVVFVQRGPAFWAVRADAPTSTWAARPDAVAALVAGVEIE